MQTCGNCIHTDWNRHALCALYGAGIFSFILLNLFENCGLEILGTDRIDKNVTLFCLYVIKRNGFHLHEVKLV